MRLNTLVLKLLMMFSIGLSMVNCSGAHEDDASLEADQQQAEDGQVVVYDEQEDQNADSQEDSQESDEMLSESEGDDAAPAVDEETEAELNNMLSRISDEQEPATSDDQFEDDSADMASSTIDDQSEVDMAETASTNDDDQMVEQVTDYTENSADGENVTEVVDAEIDMNQGESTYRVQPGDSLSKISQRYYGAFGFYKALASANNIANPDRIYPGQIIRLVDAGSLSAAAGVSEQQESMASAEPVPMTGGQGYVVQQGDSLSKISQNLYGSYKYWKVLYVANKEKIGNPNLVYPGQSLQAVASDEVANYMSKADSVMQAH